MSTTTGRSSTQSARRPGGATLVGSSSADEFTEQGANFESVTVSLVASDEMQFAVGLGTGLREDIQGAVADAARDLPEMDDDYPHRMGINLHDGLVGRGEEIAMLGYQEYPMPYTGASAADDLALEETVVFADDTVDSLVQVSANTVKTQIRTGALT